MRKFILGLLLLSIPILLYAATEDKRISDNGGDVLVISSDGYPTMTGTNDTNTVTVTGAKDYRISDGDGDVLSINSDGSINLTLE